MLSQADVIEMVHDSLLPAFTAEKTRLDRVDLWYRWDQETPKLPPKATREMKSLVELAKTPWLGLVVATVAQTMYVDGYRSPDNRDNGGPWRTWNGNDFDARQVAVHEAALAYGTSYVTVLPGTGPDGAAMSVLRGVSPRRMLAFYADPAEDDWPMFAIRAEGQTDKTWAIRVYDEEAVYRLSASSDGTQVDYIDDDGHDAGVCPVVRYANKLDLDGRADGEVEPFIGVAARVNKTMFDRLLTQHFSSWKVRTVAGMAEPEDEEEANRTKLRLRQDDLLVAEDPDTKFGTLDETPLDGFIKAWDSDLDALAAVSQIPSHNLTGKMVNLSAEALAAARASLTQKVTQRQKSFGKSHDQVLRLAAALEGDDVAAMDTAARVTWQDMEIRSLAQAVDALGKAATMLGIPPRALWSRIPGVTKSDTDEWTQIAEEGDAFSALTQMLDTQTTPTPVV